MHRSFVRRFAIPATLSALVLLVAGPAQGTVHRFDVPMTCFPAPDAPATPPCLVPAGLDPATLDGTSGRMVLKTRADGATSVMISLDGLDPAWVITAWVSYYFPGPGVIPPDPVFGTAEGPGVAAVSAPLAPTTAAFTEGMGPEPNQMTVKSNGEGFLWLVLDYDPLRAGQGPLRNDLVFTEQTAAPEGSAAMQPECCGSAIQAVGSSYLRVFDEDGFQVLDAAGAPELVRSPVPVAFVVLVIHLDGTTHGINPGVPVFPFPGVPASAGDHYVLGLFDLSDL